MRQNLEKKKKKIKNSIHSVQTEPYKAAVRGAWVAHLVEHLTLGFCLGHDLMGGGIKPRVSLRVQWTV